VSDTIVIPVPERLLAVYAVATDEPVEESVSHSSGGVAVDVVPVDAAPLPPAGLLRAMGARMATLARLGLATHAVLVRSVGTAGFPSAAELAAYAAAQTIADAYDGVLLDTVIPRVVETPREVEDQFRLSDWVVLPHSPDAEGGLWFTTKGLVRFGLPELQSHGIPESAANAWGAVLTGVAQVLCRRFGDALAENPAAAFVELPAVVQVSLRDIARGYSDRSRVEDDPRLDEPVELGVTWDPAPQDGAESFLTVHPPTAEPVQPWVGQVVRRLFGTA
jgi:hypothetical protein